MKLNPEQHGKGREGESTSRRSSFARARSQLTQAVGDVLAGREGKRPGGWLGAFGALGGAPASENAERLREVLIRDRALFAANPRPRRTLREEEEEEAANAAATQAERDADALDTDLTIVAAAALVLPADGDAPHAELGEEAVQALAAALDAAADAERTAPEDATDEQPPRAVEPAVEVTAGAQPSTAEAAAAPRPAQPEEALAEAPRADVAAEPEAEPAEVAVSAEPEVAAAAPVAEPTPLDQIAAKATKVKSRAGAREGSAKPKREPIRTRTMARLLASQGHHRRALSIYDELIAADTNDASLREEADALRGQTE